MSADMLAAAERLAACGFDVLPIKSGSKAPACEHGVKDATKDAAQLKRWFSTTSNTTGVSGEGFIIFDFDCHNDVDGRETLADWEREHGELPETLAQTTPSGGYHLFYRCAEEVRPSVNGELAVDVRAWGSYVVCDPTPGYCWETDPLAESIADADERVMAFLEHVRPKRAERGPLTVPDGKVRKGEGRNNFLYEQGCSARAKGSDDATIEAFLTALNNAKCNPPLDDAELSKTIASVCTRPIGLSAEAKEAQGRKGQPNHLKYGKRLIAERHACIIGDSEEGTPAIMSQDGKSYRLGWNAITVAHLDLYEGAKIAEQREVRNFIKYRAPHARLSDPHLIAFKNGVLDVRTMELREFTHEDIIPNVIPHDWNPEAQSNVVDAVLARISAGDPTVEKNLCEFAGLCLYRDSAKYGYMAILLGREGQDASNGKSTYIKMLAHMLGGENYSVLDMQGIGEKFAASYIVGKLANLGDDIPPDYTDGRALSIVKKAVTGEELFTDVKNKEGFKFRPYATMVFSANKVPHLGDTSDGMMRRIFPIRFNAHFSPEDPDYDPDVSDKLATEEAAERLIVRAVTGLRRVLDNRRPTPNRESIAMARDIRMDNNNVLQWIESEGVTASDCAGKMPSSVFAKYEDWCKENGYGKYTKGVREFGKTLCSELGLESVPATVDGKKRRFYKTLDGAL